MLGIEGLVTGNWSGPALGDLIVNACEKDVCCVLFGMKAEEKLVYGIAGRFAEWGKLSPQFVNTLVSSLC